MPSDLYRLIYHSRNLIPGAPAQIATEVDKILEEGKDYARSIASETLAEVREKMGLV